MRNFWWAPLVPFIPLVLFGLGKFFYRLYTPMMMVDGYLGYQDDSFVFSGAAFSVALTVAVSVYVIYKVSGRK